MSETITTYKGAAISTGIDLRDYFAAQAMPVLLAQTTEFPDENWRFGVALDAYMMADAMLIARGAREKGAA